MRNLLRFSRVTKSHIASVTNNVEAAKAIALAFRLSRIPDEHNIGISLVGSLEWYAPDSAKSRVGQFREIVRQKKEVKY